MASLFENKTWSEQWQYSEYPYLNGSIGSANYLAYPPSAFWSLSMDNNNSCSKIKYSAVFKWDELIQCKTDDGISNAVDVDIDDKYINMTGKFFIDVVSPISMESDQNIYYKYELLSYPFSISIEKSIHIFGDINTYLFTASIIYVGKDNDNENILNLKLLTESADYISLNNPKLLASNDYDKADFTFIEDTADCLSISSDLCSQIWDLRVDVGCPFTFNGDLLLQMELQLLTCNNPQCTDYINTYGPIVTLTPSFSFSDYICDINRWDIKYNAEMNIYRNDSFLMAIADNYQFVVGQDRVFVEIAINEFGGDNDNYTILNSQLLNVWLCTSDNQLSLNENNITNSGCFSSNIDSDGPYHVIVNYDEVLTNEARHEMKTLNNLVRFSFIVPADITRDTLYIHAHIDLEFSNGNITNRRLLSSLSKDERKQHLSSNDMIYLMGSISLIKYNDEIIYVEEEHKNESHGNVQRNDSAYIYVIIATMVLLTLTVAFLYKYKCRVEGYNHPPNRVM